MVENVLSEAYDTAITAGGKATERLNQIFHGAERKRTTVRFVHTDRLAERFYFNSQHTTVAHEFSTQTKINAFSVLAFPSDIEREIVDSYSFTDIETQVDPTKFFESKLREVGHTISNGIIDEWADNADVDIELTTPTCRRGVFPEMLLPEELRWLCGVVPLFETEIKAGDHEFTHYFILSSDAHVHNLIGQSRKNNVSDFPRSIEAIVAEGAVTAEENLNQQLGRTQVSVSDWSLQYTSIDNVIEYGPDGEMIGCFVDIEETLDGIAYVSFEPNVAYDMSADLLDQADLQTTEELTESVINEIAMNMLTSFSDGWANVAEHTIDYTPPVYERSEMDEVMNKMKQSVYSEEVFLLTVQLVTPADGECWISVICEPEGIVDTAADLEMLFPD